MNMPWTLARQTARAAAKPLDAAELALPDALGLALASAVRALTSQPTCDTSAMDGYAVAGPGPWTVVGRVAAGDPVPALSLGPGEAFGVATGAPVPDGSDSVLPVERCSIDGTQLREDRTAPDERGRRNDPTPRQHDGPAPANRHDHPARATGSPQPEPSPPSSRTLRGEADPSGNHAVRREGPSLGSRSHSREATPPNDHESPLFGKHIRRQGEGPPLGSRSHSGEAFPPHSHEPPPLGRHIRRRGEDWSAGDELIPAGSLISPAVLGLAAAAGHDTLLAHRRPRVTVIVTGDELLHTGPPRPGRVRDAIGPMLPGLLTRADLIGTTHLRDDPSALANALRSDEADVLVTCGATSVGPADHLRTVLTGLDAEILVSGVACRPGHPMLLAVLPDGRCVVGLPGNPFAALAAVLTLLHPLLDTLGGHTTRPPITAWLGDVNAHPRDTRLIPVTRTGNAAVRVGHDRPGSLWGAALADALAVVPPGHQGGEVELLA